MQKQILVMTMNNSRRGYEVGRVLEEAQRANIPVKHVAYRQMQFDLKKDGSRVLVGGVEVDGENTAGVWFRVAGTKTGKYPIGRAVLIRNLTQKGVFCVNRGSYTNWERMGKIAQSGVFTINSIPIVPTRVFYTRKQVESFDFKYPVIVKHDRGFQGRSVKKLDNKESLLKQLYKIEEIKLGMWLWQDYLPLKWDIRVIVIGGKVLGAMRRSAQGDEFRSNFSLGGAVEKWELSNEDKLIAEKVAEVCQLDYCGVDIMKDEKGNSFVLEVNRQCQFQGFEKSTGINVAKAVVDLMIKNRYI